MALFSILTRVGAASALAFVTLAPLASAEDRGRGDRGGHYDRGDRGNRGEHGHRGNRGDRGDRGHNNRGDWNRGHNNRGGNWDRGRDNRHNNHSRYYNRGNHHVSNHRVYSPPRVINRHYYSAPSYAYRSRPHVSYHYNTGYHHPRYRIGSRYDYSPRTIVITDYDRYGLYRPPHGHHWVRDPYSGDAVLASVATGAIIGLAIGILSQ